MVKSSPPSGELLTAEWNQCVHSGHTGGMTAFDLGTNGIWYLIATGVGAGLAAALLGGDVTISIYTVDPIMESC